MDATSSFGNIGAINTVNTFIQLNKDSLDASYKNCDSGLVILIRTKLMCIPSYTCNLRNNF